MTQKFKTMTISYKKINGTELNADGTESSPCLTCIQKKVDGVGVCMIPLNEGNTDYQAYLTWVAEGNTAEAAD